VVREVLERGAREGRARLDDARRSRRRDDALARLGEAVLEAVRDGELQDIYDIPDAADALADLDGLDAGAEEPPPPPEDREPPLRARFDRRPPRPPPIEPREGGDDGTVSSGARPRRPAEEPGSRFQERPTAPAPAPARRGGIQFSPAPGDEDEDDLAQYMHPDDVPKRSSDE
jgi:hypothetical protein